MTFKEKNAQMSEDKLWYQAMLHSAGMSMRWYNFLVKIAIPFRLVFETASAWIKLTTSINQYYDGSLWSYLTHPQLFLSNVVFVVSPILDAVILLILSRHLFTFDRKAPKSLLLFLYVNVAAYGLILVNLLALPVEAKEWPPIVGECVGQAIFYLCNFVYFYKRKHLFTQSESQARQERVKTVYCKRCGSVIDSETRKCSGCGKQYFHLSVRPRSIVAGAAMLLVFSSMAYGMYEKDKQIKFFQHEYLLTQEIADAHRKHISELENELRLRNSLDSEKADFLDDNVALVSDNWINIYHRLDCTLINGDETYLALIDDLIYMGYNSCTFCEPRS